jgi:Abortive infection alpha
LISGDAENWPENGLGAVNAVPLLAAAILEEDDELRDAWARLLVNAADAATEMELRTAYVEILNDLASPRRDLNRCYRLKSWLMLGDLLQTDGAHRGYQNRSAPQM